MGRVLDREGEAENFVGKRLPAKIGPRFIGVRSGLE
jgi:hypothetical protein